MRGPVARHVDEADATLKTCFLRLKHAARKRKITTGTCGGAIWEVYNIAFLNQRALVEVITQLLDIYRRLGELHKRGPSGT